jgi:hypothetical protein
MDNEVDKFLEESAGKDNPFKEESTDPFESKQIKKEEFNMKKQKNLQMIII